MTKATMLDLCITRVECIVESGHRLFRIKVVDDCCSSIKMDSLMTPELWPEVSAKIAEALRLIHPGAAT
jgi:hypothetical protein